MLMAFGTVQSQRIPKIPVFPVAIGREQAGGDQTDLLPKVEDKSVCPPSHTQMPNDNATLPTPCPVPRQGHLVYSQIPVCHGTIAVNLTSFDLRSPLSAGLLRLRLTK